MWKAFREMMMMGWIPQRMPRFVAVQSENCSPVVDKFFERKSSDFLPTIANGLAVPTPFAHVLIQQILKETSGTAIAISEDDIRIGAHEMAAREGILACPEGGALVPALKKLLASGNVKPEEKILLLNTGSGYKYL
jgi:threonine synthase